MRYFFSIFTCLYFISCASSKAYRIVESMNSRIPYWYSFPTVWSSSSHIFFKVDTQVSYLKYPITSCIDLSYKKAKYSTLKEIHSFIKNYPQYEKIYQAEEGRSFLAFLAEGSMPHYDIEDQYWEIIEENNNIYRKCYAIVSIEKSSFLTQAEIPSKKESLYNQMMHSFFYYTQITQKEYQLYTASLSVQNSFLEKKPTSFFIETPNKTYSLGNFLIDSKNPTKELNPILYQLKEILEKNNYTSLFLESYFYDSSFIQSLEISRKNGSFISDYLKNNQIKVSQEYYLGNKYPSQNDSYEKNSSKIIIKLDTLPQIKKIFSPFELAFFESYQK